MWQREVIGQQTYLNTQDAVYEVLSKTPEEVLCKSPDAVKIDMMLKQSAEADYHPNYNVRYVPYRNVGNGMVINPNSGGNFSEKVALAIAFIAADRSDWQRFIPVGIKTREIAKTKKREQEIVEKQNMPFKDRKKRDDEEDEEEFETVDRNEDVDGDSASETSDAEDKPLKVYDNETKEWVDATEEEQNAFVFDIQETPQPQKPKPSLEQKTKLEEDAVAAQQLNDRVAQVLRDQEERALAEEKMLPYDRKRRHVASLNDPASEANAAVIAQHYHGADAEFDIEDERAKAKERECGVKSVEKKPSIGLLDRFAPEETISMKPIAHEKGKAPQYSIQQLMEFGSRTKPPPSAQRMLDQKNNVQEPTPAAPAAPPATVKPDLAAKISSKCLAIRRKQVELAALMIDLEELIQ